MVPDYKSSAGVATGDTWAAWLIEHHTELGINYVIWNVKIWVASSADAGWQPYTHPSGATDDTNAHKDHVHVSVHGNAGTGFAPGGDVVGGWAFPAKAGAVVTSSYSPSRFHPTLGIWRPHNGTDFASAVGDPIYAAAGGTVKSVTRMHFSAGNWVVISHGGGVETGYMHMSRIDVAEGQVVQAGQLIGAAGATGGVSGPHLHFEVKVNGLYTDPVPFLQQKGVY
nr:M23 family metallopeptidase [Cellulosimicrobium sp. Marseille-Q4280]